jgi:hypothetical protein
MSKVEYHERENVAHASISSGLRLTDGLPRVSRGNQIARDYDLNPSSLHRHRVNCLGLSSSNAIMKEVARGTPAIT